MKVHTNLYDEIDGVIFLFYYIFKMFTKNPENMYHML